MGRAAVRTVLVTVRAWALGGFALGSALAAVTAWRNAFRSVPDVLRLDVALGLVFALVFAAVGAVAGLLLAATGRGRDRTGALAFAAALATTAFLWAARAFEFEWAYPARWPFVSDFPGMLAFVSALVVLGLGAAWLLGTGAFAVARRLPGVTWGRAAGAVGSAVLLSVAVLAAVPRPSRPEPASLAAAAAPAKPAAAPAVMPVPNRTRVLLVGCDGADPDVVQSLIAEGALPNLERIADRGVRCPLRTIARHPSPALWTSIASSRRPRDTGILDFYVQSVFGAATPVAEFPRNFGLNDGLLLRDVLGPRAIGVTPVNSDMVRVRRLWSILAGAGVTTGVVDWLVTWPARTEGAAFVVSDRAWSERRVARDADTPLDPVAADGEAPLWDPPEVASLLPAGTSDWATEDAFAAATALALHAAYAPQVLMVYFRDVDAAEHLSWDRWEPARFRGREGVPPRSGPVRDAYVAFDRHVGALCDAVGPAANVIVVSDHGHHAWFTWLGRGTPGGHTDAPPGVLIAAGPDVRTPPVAPDASVYDVAPTVLQLAGLPVAADMEGRALEEILVDASPRPVVATYETGDREAGAPVATEADAAMIERLRALGYIR